MNVCIAARYLIFHWTKRNDSGAAAAFCSICAGTIVPGVCDVRLRCCCCFGLVCVSFDVRRFYWYILAYTQVNSIRHYFANENRINGCYSILRSVDHCSCSRRFNMMATRHTLACWYLSLRCVEQQAINSFVHGLHAISMTLDILRRYAVPTDGCRSIEGQ